MVRFSRQRMNVLAMPDATQNGVVGDVEDAAPCRIGVLALQGSFREHMSALRRLPGVVPVEVRTREQLASISGLIIPGVHFQPLEAARVDARVGVGGGTVNL